MKIPINLASQPFRRDRAMILASLMVSLLLVATLATLVSLALQDRKQLADVRHEVDALNQQIRGVTAEQSKLNTIVGRPENTLVLERSVFLNTLLRRKGVSWNQIFTDLENTIPYNVKIVRIHPTVDAQDHVMLDMTVAAENLVPLIEMLKAFHQSPLFGNVDERQQLPPTQSEPLYRMQLSVPYAQKL
ncbi:MAG TPA: hypothetical protein VLY04_25575 [Bryobacteraceae bacterium]|nr:hypothetical protein [Bryobacteraceae bacterium]